MSEEQPTSTNLGAGDKESDPATAENPPEEIKSGDEKREKGPSPGTATTVGVD